MKKTLVCMLALAVPLAAAAASPVRAVLDPVAGQSPRTEVLVLATPHLAEIDGFQPRFAAPVVDVLARFRPTVICVEVIPGEDLALMEEAGGRRREIAAMFAERPMTLGRNLQRTMKVSRVEALLRAEERLRGDLTDEARIRLVGDLMAAYEYPSASLQWSYLPAQLRASTLLLPDDVKKYLDERLASNNEISAIAISVARRLGLHTLVPVDDHDGAAKLLALPEAQIEELFGHPRQKESSKAPVYARSAEAIAAGIAGENFLPVYLHFNSDGHLTSDLEAQWGWYWKTKLDSGADRLRFSLWELRNLEIAAKVAAQTASTRPERVLLIIGAAHKRFVEESLSGLVHVRLVEFERLAAGDR